MTNATKSAGPPSDLSDGIIEFVQHFLPPLGSGDYSVEITQKVAQGAAGAAQTPLDTYASTYEFLVGGVRFTLAPTELAAAFPPDGNQGEYSNSLPHLVFFRRTLPWERSLVAGQMPPKPPLEPDVPSWMALLAFQQNELPQLNYQPGTLASLLPAAAGGEIADPTVMSYPGLFTTSGNTVTPNLERGEQLTDKLTYLDIPLSLFNAMAPSVDDLTVLAHARTVDIAAKSDTQTRVSRKPTGITEIVHQDYSVLVSNRLPASGETGIGTEVHLVSLEGMSQFLPKDTTYQSSTQFPAGVKTLRLASLFKWNFVSLTPDETFAELVEAVDAGPLGLPATGTPSTSDEKLVADAISFGYVPLRHETRNGQTTVSWYRGPLLPFAVTDSDSFPKDHPDSLLRYNPDNGMLDVSYAAAWQLGQLLGLNQKGYARDLYQFKKLRGQQAARQIELDLMAEKWGDLVPDNAGQLPTAELYRELFSRVVKRHLETFSQVAVKSSKHPRNLEFS